MSSGKFLLDSLLESALSAPEPTVIDVPHTINLPIYKSEHLSDFLDILSRLEIKYPTVVITRDGCFCSFDNDADAMAVAMAFDYSSG
jgi:hypothetical protein